MKNKIKINRLHLAILIAISLISFSCKDAIQEIATTRHVSKHASSNGTPDLTPNTNGIVPAVQTPNSQTPAVQTEEEKLKDDIAKEANCPSTAPTYDFNTFAKLPDNAARLHWLRCALKTQVAIDALKIATGGQSKQTLLHSAADKGDLESVKLLVNIVKIDVNVKDGKGLTALMWAAVEGNLDVVEYLAKPIASGGAGSDVNMMSNDGWIALMYAAVNDHLDVVEYLAKPIASGGAGSDVNAKDNSGRTALMLAADYDCPDVVEYLAKPTPGGAGADVTLTDNNQKTACDRATGKSNEQAMKTAMHDCQ